MASALDLIAKGQRDLKNIPLEWYVSSGVGSSSKDIPMALPKGWTNPGGLQKLTQAEAIQRMKGITLHDSKYLKGRISDAAIADNLKYLQKNYPGIKADQNLYDWLMSSSGEGNLSLERKFLKDPTTTDPNSVELNGQFYDRNTAEKLLGMSLEEAKKQSLAEGQLKTKMQGEQAAEAKRQAEIKTYTDAGKPVPQELLAPGQGEGNGKDGFQVGPGGDQTQASGKPATNVVKQQDGTYAVTDTSGNVLQSGFQNIAQALAVQNQITVGSTPQLSGRPDVFAVQPTQAEIDAGIQPIVPQAGMAPVQPKVAELKDLEALQAGTLPTPKAEAATGTLVGSTIDTEGLTDEQIKNADTLANAIASDDSLLYVPKISPADIDGYIASGKLDAAKELDPYYKEIIGRTKETYLQSVLFETKARELSMRQEALNRAKEKKSIQDDLERRGATYTGEASEELGVESALSPELNSVIEGLMQKRQDIVTTSSKQQFEKNIALLTQSAEEQLGTQAVKDITGADTSSLSASLFKVLGTPTMGSIAADQTTNIETRAKELAKGQVAKELAKSSDFPTSEYLKYI